MAIFINIMYTTFDINFGCTVYTLLGKKEKKNSAEKERFLSLSLFTTSVLPETNIENRILIGCAPCTMTPVNTLPAAKEKKFTAPLKFLIGK